MESELRDTIDIGCHEGHNLGLAGEIVFVFILLLLRGLLSGFLVLVVSRRSGGRDILANKSLRIQNTVELYPEANLQVRS